MRKCAVSVLDILFYFPLVRLRENWLDWDHDWEVVFSLLSQLAYLIRLQIDSRHFWRKDLLQARWEFIRVCGPILLSIRVKAKAHYVPTHLLEGDTDRASTLGRANVDSYQTFVVWVEYKVKAVGSIRPFTHFDGFLPYVGVILQRNNFFLLWAGIGVAICTGGSGRWLIILILVSLNLKSRVEVYLVIAHIFIDINILNQNLETKSTFLTKQSYAYSICLFYF